MNRIFPLLLVFLLLGCGPKEAKEEVSALPAPGRPSTLEEVADSVSNTRIDGTDTDTNTGLPQDPKQQLPAELEVFLDGAHGLWRFPPLPAQDSLPVAAGEQGPYFVQADFNRDRQPDYAVQIVERDSVFLYAFVRNSGKDGFKEHVLDRYFLGKAKDANRNPHYVSLAREQHRKSGENPGEKAQAGLAGILVKSAKGSDLYVWEKGKFRKTTTRTPGGK